jgi:hypothetical protein
MRLQINHMPVVVSERISIMRYILIALVATLTGCAASGTGNSAGITYTMVGNLNIMAAQKNADEHCAKYGKVAQLNTTGNLMASFKCVAP